MFILVPVYKTVDKTQSYDRQSRIHHVPNVGVSVNSTYCTWNPVGNNPVFLPCKYVSRTLVH